jgi:hypothetical protein
MPVNGSSEEKEQPQNRNKVQIHPKENGKQVYTLNVLEVIYQNDVNTDQKNNRKKG